ncbi:MAG: hypothetical protein BWX96_02967 [Bacteroidetes bacterium ADurb.Bin145]|jgi:hypothetical protein|nr:MAG: hypothetical protein BWX96_02967 [Bacteroidetes bacterium ADurb.Bin145]
MSHNIFILHDNDVFTPLLVQEYESEGILMRLLINEFYN